MEKPKKIDIIIPVKRINDYIYESVPIILNLKYDNYSIVILPDEVDNEKELSPLMEKAGSTDNQSKIQIIETGPIGPAEKRDLAIKHCDGDILAFLDDDAYPREDWLTNAVQHFTTLKVGAVGGPAITPPHDTFWQKVSGAVFLSTLSGGNPDRYWSGNERKEVDDWPSVNLLVRKDLFRAIGGFNSKYWPGEDTKLCLDITYFGKKIIYDPEVIVWHHRREGLDRHLKQIAGYGLHRGFFARVYPENSRKFKYFIPSLFVCFLFAGFIFQFLNNPLINSIYYLGIGAYLFSLSAAFYQIYKKTESLLVSTASTGYIFLTHIWYGINFIKGFLTKKLKSKLRE
ncbi:MAG: glycosyltransferase [Candidatus Magnetoovum sp. WYHC-5]|nr:glycosyltransferase [Candidatus Magnetoovum sp. WYHC-5]